MTSPPSPIRVECRRCGTVWEDWHRPSINARLDPEMAADQEYLREASTATCPKCRHVAEIGTLIVDFDGTYRRDHPSCGG